MLIDLQNAIEHPSWGRRNNPDAEEQIAKLLATWRVAGMPIIHVKHMSTDPDSHYQPEQTGNDFRDFVKPESGEEVVEKDTNSAFVRTDLEQRLRERGINDIVIAGVITNNSVEATARTAGNLGFRAIVVSDATYTFGKADYARNWRTAQEVHDMSLANLAGEYAEILDSPEILRLL